MLLTRIWSVILAVLAVGCLAGMFLLSAVSGGGFSEADKAAIRAVTEAGVASLEAEIQAAPVQQVSGALSDPRLLKAINRTEKVDPEKLPPDELPLDQILAEVAESLRVNTNSNITLAVVDKTGAIAAVNGIAEPNIGELVASDAYKAVPPTEEAVFSITLGSEIYVTKVTRSTTAERRLLAVDTLRIGAGSLLRRVLGSQTPAGLVRKGQLVGDIIGDQPVASEIETLARDHQEDVSEQGASRVFTVGTGTDARLGCLGRVPGPAGHGRAGAMLAVLSYRTAAAGKRDLAAALGEARDESPLGSANYALLVGLFLVSAGLAVYLPQLEATGPMRRLAREFQAVSQGAQHQIFHDRYSGAPGEVARSAAAAVEALRQAFLAELEIDDDISDDPGRPRTSGRKRLTRAHQKLSEKRGGTGPEATPARRKRRTGSRPQEPIAEPIASEEEPLQTTAPTPRIEPHPDMADEPATEPMVPAMRPGSGPHAHGLPLTEPAATPMPPPPVTPSRPTAAPPQAASARHPTPIVHPQAGATQPPLPGGAQPPPHGGTQPPLSRPSASAFASGPHAPPVARPPGLGGGTQPPPSSGAGAPPPAADPKEAAYRDIFDEFIQVKAACGEPTENLTFDRFAAKLRKNERDLMKKRPGIREVQFTVYVKDGKAALKAKVVK